MKVLNLFLVFLFILDLNVFAQKDTLKKKKNMLTLAYHSSFWQLNHKDKNFYNNNNYAFGVDFSFLYGYSLSSFDWWKSGLEMIYKERNFVNDSSRFHYSETFFQIPVLFTYKNPIECFNCKRESFTEIGGGLYYSFSGYQEIISVDKTSTIQREKIYFGYVKWGMIGDFSISFLSKNGRGHVFGIRSTIDFWNTANKFNDIEIIPYINTISIYYNIVNIYW